MRGLTACQVLLEQHEGDLSQDPDQALAYHALADQRELRFASSANTVTGPKCSTSALMTIQDCGEGTVSTAMRGMRVTAARLR